VIYTSQSENLELITRLFESLTDNYEKFYEKQTVEEVLQDALKLSQIVMGSIDE